MVIGLLKEMGLNEYRVALVPDNVYSLQSYNLKVIVQQGAGLGSGFSDEEYEKAGALIVAGVEEVYNQSEVILHVQPPHPDEYEFIKEGHVIMSFMYSTTNRDQARFFSSVGATVIGFETVEELFPKPHFPILSSMSEISGRTVPLQAAHLMQTFTGGTGMFPGGVAGVFPARVLVIGSGAVGREAARVFSAMGADVSIMGVNIHQLREIENISLGRVNTAFASRAQLIEVLPTMDIVVGAVYHSHIRTPKVLSRHDLKIMKPKSLLMDVAIDQGGCFESSRPTTIQNPTYVLDDILHYCVPNIPVYYARTSSISLSSSIFQYVAEIGCKGLRHAASENRAIAKGVHFAKGKVYHSVVADIFGLEYALIDEFLSD